MQNLKPYNQQSFTPKVIQAKINHRENSLDILRGIAVILMISAHFTFFFHKGDNSNLTNFQKIGDTLAFVTFLFVSGASTFILLEVKKNSGTKFKAKVLNRVITLLIGYYFIAIVSNFKQYDFSSDTWIYQISEILILKNVPGFTEFMIPFIFITLIQLIIPSFLRIVGKNLIAAMSLGLILYIAGSAIYQINFEDNIRFPIMLFSGSEGFYRFPILQYMIVFLIGLWTGSFLFFQKNIYVRRKRLFQLFIFFLIVLLAVFFLRPFEKYLGFSEFERWPPTIGFILMGVTFSVFSIFFVIKKSTSEKIPTIYAILSAIGKDSFLFFLIHILFLQIYDIVIGYKSNSPIIVAILAFVFSIIVLYGVKALKYASSSFSNTFRAENAINYSAKNSGGFGLGYKLLGLMSVIVISIGIFYISAFDKKTEATGFSKRESQINVEIIPKRTEKIPIWWNYDYAYLRKISIFNQSTFNQIKKGDIVSFEIDHQTLIRENKSLQNGNDLRVVYLDNNETYVELQTVLDSPGSESTKIFFRSSTDVEPGTSEKNYYLYFGNKLAQSPPQFNIANNESMAETTKIVLASEKQGVLSLAINKYWVLKDRLNSDNSKLTVSMNINDSSVNTSKDFSYKILGTPLTGRFFETSQDKVYESKIDISTLKPGIYQIQAETTVENAVIASPKESFIVSYPLYVAWTIDWEGMDVRDNYLASMERISNDYKIPMTHFYNPRIFVALNNTRSQTLTNWVKQREQKGDAIGLHLHMYYDMAQAAGVDPYNTGGLDIDGNPIESSPRPQWGSQSQGGYDVLLTSYSYDETTKVVEWAKQKFSENGLKEPIGFRSGGWFIDLENLSAIEDAGFLYDSSGRTEYIWGSKRQAGPWTLSSTTQPFRPSRQDQNSPNPAPNFALWEFPNNGADSYTFSANDMINRFNDNYQGGFVDDKKIVTYLSHPEWFNIDEPKLDELFKHINQYLYTNDNGPVIFITLDEAYKSWT